MNIFDKDGHANPVERSNRSVNERVKCLTQILPFSYMPSHMIEAVIDVSIQNFNILPHKTSIYKHLSPLATATGSSSCKFETSTPK